VHAETSPRAAGREADLAEVAEGLTTSDVGTHFSYRLVSTSSVVAKPLRFPFHTTYATHGSIQSRMNASYLTAVLEQCRSNALRELRQKKGGRIRAWPLLAQSSFKGRKDAR
jgi:hypothetical protein